VITAREIRRMFDDLQAYLAGKGRWLVPHGEMAFQSRKRRASGMRRERNSGRGAAGRLTDPRLGEAGVRGELIDAPGRAQERSSP